MTLHDEINAAIKSGLASATSIGTHAIGDPNFVREYRNGRRIWPETEARIREHLAALRDAVAGG